MLQDPLDDNVVPIVEELQRRLASAKPLAQAQAEDEENLGAQNDVENNDENGMINTKYDTKSTYVLC